MPAAISSTVVPESRFVIMGSASRCRNEYLAPHPTLSPDGGEGFCGCMRRRFGSLPLSPTGGAGGARGRWSAEGYLCIVAADGRQLWPRPEQSAATLPRGGRDC